MSEQLKKPIAVLELTDEHKALGKVGAPVDAATVTPSVQAAPPVEAPKNPEPQQTFSNRPTLKAIDGKKKGKGKKSQAEAQVDDGTKRVSGHRVDELVAVTQSMTPQELIRLVATTGIRHLVQKDGIAYDAEVEAAKKILTNPNCFITDPIETILGPAGEGARMSFKVTCSASERKTQTLTSFGDFVAGLPGSRTIWDQALLIADELYTNGSKNAWDPGTGVFNGPPVRTGTVEFFAEATKDRLVIGCRDSFGKLNVEHAVNRIATCYENGVAQSIKHGNGGAGIGTYMVFDSSLSYYAGVDENRWSCVCVVLPLGLSRRQATGLPKNIHLISIKAKERAA